MELGAGGIRVNHRLDAAFFGAVWIGVRVFPFETHADVQCAYSPSARAPTEAADGKPFADNGTC